MRRPVAGIAVLVLALAALAGVAASAPRGPAAVKTGTSSLGRIVVDGKSRTLYLFEKDRGGRSACSAACAHEWPPLLTKGKPKAGPGARRALLGTVKRSDGTTQVTYAKHPLYTFAGDQGKRGATTGQGLSDFGAKWYAVTAKGTARTGRY